MSTTLRITFDQGRDFAFITVPREIAPGSEELMDWMRSVQGGNAMTDTGRVVVGSAITSVRVYQPTIVATGKC